MILAENFPQNGPLHFQANNIPVASIKEIKQHADLISNVLARLI